MKDGVTRELQMETRANSPLRVPVLNPWSPGDGKCRIVMLWIPYTGLVPKSCGKEFIKAAIRIWCACIACVFYPTNKRAVEEHWKWAGFPSSPPACWAAASGFPSPPKAPCGKELVHRHCPFLLVEKRSSCFMVAWRPQSCLLPGLLLQCFQQSAWLQGEAEPCFPPV